MRAPGEAYAELIRRERETAILASCASLLEWDHQTYMPPKGGGHRAEQLALLAGLTHQQATAPVIAELLAAVETSPLVADPAGEAAVNVREIRREYDRACRVPQALVEELARVTAQAHDVWVEARRTADFPLFRPWLERIVALKREEAEAIGYAGVPYDALLDAYEPGETAARLTPLFAGLREALVPLVAAIAETKRRPDGSLLMRRYAIARQEGLGRTVAAAFGFDFAAGRLDVTAHPFCSGIGPGDTRLTTRYNPQDFGDGFFSILHETGHGLYDQGLDPAHFGTPMGAAVSLGIHESQSRLWENLVGRSRPFWEYAFPLAQQAFPDVLAGVSPDAFHFAVNEVRPSLIRVDADEATYNLHILLRFELEQALLDGDLPVADLPGAWTDRMRAYLGVVPPDDAQGCLQDVHWSGGGLGYFPTYTLGNLYAAQFFAAARREIPGLEDGIRRGEFAPLREWLTAKIHRQGQRYRAADLIQAVTGEGLDPRFFLEYLKGKFEPLYGI
jgi:carboxypeptidase Taq